ncbi:MAG: rubrerythrin family protein [Candidatus Scalindua sp. AMX11]|nr:MAG: rubrerythrin family protein [Candidatus Scalindua sp.]NOG85712.1 rubrerythrin family protein [Planctomycetota bacterium]RZV73162.1 MAG: rubrerythrin family protein [Candidatus Scalindua sp. SCAELEC01]TDE64749.1 MAG: rubrerythrin family protein [Candidatus Scalindua sp. AMX11]GJQ58687.1 MAG: hypothetical protein SCALA701_14880 [Candidatus Scalindua sp.]
MNTDLSKLVDESIRLELYVADIYMIFYKIFPEDSVFWWKLVLEEKHHAALIESIKNTVFSNELFDTSFQVLLITNNKLASLINEYNQNPPSRESAFNTALEIEQSTGELHVQLVMEKSAGTIAVKIFQELNSDNKDHLNRIRSYMATNGIEIRNSITK